MLSQAFHAFHFPWNDESLWLPAVAWLLLIATALSGGLPGVGPLGLVLLAVAIQLLPAAGLLIFHALGNQPLDYEVPVLLGILQSLNIATLIGCMGAALPVARARSVRPPPETATQTDSGTGPCTAAVLAERRRIASDLHDGVAARLVMLLAGLPSQAPPYEEIARGLQDCLQDLQMTVDDLGGEHVSLGEMLADLRYRVEPAFQRAGIQLLWKVPELLPQAEDERGGDVRVHREACKIVQEALNNALRHSGARCVQVELSHGGGNTPSTLQVSDDGHGLHGHAPDAVSHRQGQGLRNIHARAMAIQAQLHITNLAPHGLRVSLTLPRTARPRRPAPD